jgi:glutathione S-transferase
MILVGQYDSPFVRRVAVSPRVLGLAYKRDTRSVFADFDAMRRVNPLGRIPSLVLDDGETLIDSAAILDWLDQSVGLARALIPPAEPERRRMLHPIALATGAIDKAGTATYERLIRPSHYRGQSGSNAVAPRRRGRLKPSLPSPGQRPQPQSGAHHHRLHDPLRADIRSRSHTARSLSGA